MILLDNFKDSDITKTELMEMFLVLKLIVDTAKISVSKAGTTAEGIILADNTEQKLLSLKFIQLVTSQILLNLFSLQPDSTILMRDYKTLKCTAEQPY